MSRWHHTAWLGFTLSSNMAAVALLRWCSVSSQIVITNRRVIPAASIIFRRIQMLSNGIEEIRWFIAFIIHLLSLPALCCSCAGKLRYPHDFFSTSVLTHFIFFKRSLINFKIISNNFFNCLQQMTDLSNSWARLDHDRGMIYHQLIEVPQSSFLV